MAMIAREWSMKIILQTCEMKFTAETPRRRGAETQRRGEVQISF